MRINGLTYDINIIIMIIIIYLESRLTAVESGLAALANNSIFIFFRKWTLFI